jgi:hypothetical protein
MWTATPGPARTTTAAAARPPWPWPPPKPSPRSGTCAATSSSKNEPSTIASWPPCLRPRPPQAPGPSTAASSTSLMESSTSSTALPLFAFLDTFGLGVPFEQLTGKLMARAKRRGQVRIGPATEVMINFVHAGLYRTAGKLDIDSTDTAQLRNAETTIADVDANLGGAWWQAMWRSAAPPPARVAAIRDEYLRRVMEAAGPGWAGFRVPVSNTWRGKPIYDLVLLTQHPQGIWFFNEAVSLARGIFREHAEPEFSLVPQLWEPDDEWVGAIEANLRRLLADGRPVKLISYVRELYGETLGVARSKHLRRALRRLHASGLIFTEPKGDLFGLTVAPTARAASA